MGRKNSGNPNDTRDIMDFKRKKKLSAVLDNMDQNIQNAAESSGDITPANIGAVPESRRINNKPLTSDVTLSASDVGAAQSSHTHGNGDITGLDASKLTGTIDIARLPQGALERMTVVANDTARFALTTAIVQTGDVVKVTTPEAMYYVKDDTKLNSEAGYEKYSTGTASAVPWTGVTGKPNTLSGYGINDGAPKVHGHEIASPEQDGYMSKEMYAAVEEALENGGLGGSGLAIGNVSATSLIPSPGKAHIKWTDPEDIVIEGNILAEWAGTKLVRKAGSYPTSVTDGTLVLDSKSRNAYQSTAYIDSGLTNGTVYYYQFFPYTKGGVVTNSVANQKTATPVAVAPGDVTGLTVANAGNGKISVKWTDPDATIVTNGITMSTWAGTKVVYKAGSYPANENDGTVAKNSTTRNAHSSTALEITGLANGTVYYVALFPYNVDGTVNTNTVNRGTGTPDRFTISTNPAQNGTLTYDGNSKTPAWSNYDAAKMTLGGVTSGTNAGSYDATFTPTNDYKWSDGTTAAKTISWTIGRATISTVPTQSGTILYDGTAKTPAWSNYDSVKMTLGGTTTGTNVSSYNATFTPTSNYQWSDSTTAAKTVAWAITARTQLTVPTQSGTLTYTGSALNPTWNNYDAAKMTLGGTTSGTNAGSYNATFTPALGYEWPDGTIAAKTVSWTIGRATIATVPSQSGTLTYTGSAQSPTWSNYDSGKMTLGGTTSSIAAGSNNATFTPGANYQWSDSTTTAKTVAWTIGKAAGTLTLDKTTLTLDKNTLSGTIAVTRAGDGIITATSSDTSIATVSVSGTTVTINHVNQKNGSVTVTVKVAAGTNHNAPADKTCAIECKFISTVLNDNTWADIKAISDAGTGSSYWAVGDRKAVILSSGTVGEGSIAGTYYAFILGFNHNSAKEGANRIHFQFGFTALTGGTAISFTDSVYANTGSSAAFRMNTTNVNTGGWNSSYMRSTICPAFKNVLPSDLQAVLKTVTKYSDNTGGGSDTASYVTTTTDTIFLLSEWEVQGARTYANSAEQNNQVQYDYYKSGNSRVKYRHSATGSTAGWWLRSVRSNTSYDFCSVDSSGTAGVNYANFSLGFAPGFAV